ncbi:hypothetical protein IPC3_30995 [Pseudomonas aeruginosa]|nr:hypothetical protein IPC3_30995 [Pseudomonas aeruginosa]
MLVEFIITRLHGRQRLFVDYAVVGDGIVFSLIGSLLDLGADFGRFPIHLCGCIGFEFFVIGGDGIPPGVKVLIVVCGRRLTTVRVMTALRFERVRPRIGVNNILRLRLLRRGRFAGSWSLDRLPPSYRG